MNQKFTGQYSGQLMEWGKKTAIDKKKIKFVPHLKATKITNWGKKTQDLSAKYFTCLRISTELSEISILAIE